MITMTWTYAPAGLLGLGGSDAPACAGFGMPVAVATLPPFAPAPGTGVPAVGTAARFRQAVLQGGIAPGTEPLAHNYIGTKNDATTLGIHSSRRPLS